MRKLYQEKRYIRYSKRVARRSEKRRLLDKKKKKSFRKKLIGLSTFERQELYIEKRYNVVVVAPANLALLNDPNSVIGFITKLESALKAKKSVYVNMRGIKRIDYSTISALFAALYRSRKKGIKINGNYPKDTLSRDILDKSGFVYTLFSKDPDVGHKYNINADNQLFTLNDRNLNIVREIEKTVSQCVYGKSRKLPGLYTTLGELMDNTTTHASQQKDVTERWWLSINYDRANKKVEFIFVDYGVGILASLDFKKTSHPVKEILQKAKKTFGIDASGEHLRSIVTESAGKAYNLPFGRGEGIYGIYQALQRSEINNLFILSNNAFGDVSRNNYKRLGNNLNGTLYYWRVGDKNI